MNEDLGVFMLFTNLRSFGFLKFKHRKQYEFKKTFLSLVFLCTILNLNNLCAKEKQRKISFEQLMGGTPWQPKNEKLRLHDAKFMKEQYFQGIKQLQKKPINSIPKKIHFIWLGPKPFSENAIHNLKSWQKFHPNWEINFWTDRERQIPFSGIRMRYLDEFDFERTKSYIDNSNNWSEKSDLIRMMILIKEGGIYTDHDVVCLRKFDNFISHFDFIAGCESMHNLLELDSAFLTCTGVIISRPDHPIIKATIEEALKNWKKAEAQYPGNDKNNTFKRVILRVFVPFVLCSKKYLCSDASNSIILPTCYFHGYQAFSDQKLKKLHNKGFVYAFHQFNNSWIPDI